MAPLKLVTVISWRRYPGALCTAQGAEVGEFDTDCQVPPALGHCGYKKARSKSRLWCFGGAQFTTNRLAIEANEYCGGLERASSKDTDLLASVEKGFSEEITVSVRSALRLLGAHIQDVGGLLVIRLAFIKYLRQPVLAVVFPA